MLCLYKTTVHKNAPLLTVHLKSHFTLTSLGLLLKVTHHKWKNTDVQYSRVAQCFNPVCTCVHGSVREQDKGRSEQAFAVQVSGPLHSSPDIALKPRPLSFHHACSLFSPSLFPHCARRRAAVRRTLWHLSRQQLSVTPVNYTDWLTPLPTLILAVILPRDPQFPSTSGSVLCQIGRAAVPDGALSQGV